MAVAEATDQQAYYSQVYQAAENHGDERALT